jgi:Nucleotide modification associated domain 1
MADTKIPIDYINGETCDVATEMLREATESFIKGHQKYGPSWRRYRPYGTGMIKRMDNKAKRIANIQDGAVQMVKNESIETNFAEILTYSILYLINYERAEDKISNDDLLEYSDIAMKKIHSEHCNNVVALMCQKNNDYGEAWKDMSQEELLDEIAVKIDRMYVPVKNKDFKTVIENIEDVINYCLFSLIHIRKTVDLKRLEDASKHE